MHVVHAGGPPTSGPAGARTAGKRDILLLGWEPWGCWLVASSSPQRAVIPPGNEASVGRSRVERRGPENVRGHFVSPGSRRASVSGPFPRPRAGGLPVSPTVTRVGFVARGVTGAFSGGGERCQLCTPRRLKSTPSLSSLWESERGKICGQRAPVLGRSSQRAWGAWPEAAFSLCRQSLSRPGQRRLNLQREGADLAPVCPRRPRPRGRGGASPLRPSEAPARPGLSGFSLNLLCVLGA